jgi:hypothetical protein
MPTSSGRLVFNNSLVALLCVSFFLVSCTSLRVPIGFQGYEESAQMLHSDTNGIVVEAKALTSRQDYMEIFDDFLPEIGLVAVWLQIQNTRSSGIDSSKNKWVLNLRNRSTKQLDANSILQRYYHQRHIRMYSVHTDSQARQDLEKLMIPSGQIGSSMEFKGFIFFLIDETQKLDWNKGAILINKDIFIQERRRMEIRLPLDYASR